MKLKLVIGPVELKDSSERKSRKSRKKTEREPVLGVDVSSSQGKIDWNAVADAGISFAFIKATNGASGVDEAFSTNMRGARAAKIACGAYHSFRPKVPVADQVNNFVKTVGVVRRGDLQPVLNLENANEWTHLSPVKRIEIVVAYINGIEAALKCKTTLYMSPWFALRVFFRAKELSKYPLWIAHFTEDESPTVPKPWETWTLWQFTNKGRIEGIPTVVDLDLFYGAKEQFNQFRR